MVNHFTSPDFPIRARPRPVAGPIIVARPLASPPQHERCRFRTRFVATVQDAAT